MSSIEMGLPANARIPNNLPVQTRGSLAKDRLQTAGKIAAYIGITGFGSGVGSAIEFLAKGQVTILGPLAGGGVTFVVLIGASVAYFFAKAPM